MFARVTAFRMKPDKSDAAMAMVAKVREDIMSLPGLVQFINVMDDQGNGYVISLSESREISEGNAARVQAIWANFGDLLAEPPRPAGFEVHHNWST